MSAAFDTFDTPVGPLIATVDAAGALTSLLRDPDGLLAARHAGAGMARRPAALAAVRRQIEDYFAGRLRDFDLPLAPAGTPFQRRVWDALCAIPYGAAVSYGDLARSLGQPAAVRAVGRANGSNPICIVIPCHRVIGADRSLTGYGGGLPMKEALLRLEGIPFAAPARQPVLPGLA
ncbi:MAG TPA: methylated-DNA--[protein]-cysteine S-methyltransferase [Alphaproteobacteria bacterium]|nr:methylated-DNA--[protein]-cysteine S-methyltransferase [Alphaproteobacteria bacterium]